MRGLLALTAGGATDTLARVSPSSFPLLFAVPRRADCLAQGYEEKRFFQVDTGNATDWTENLAD